MMDTPLRYPAFPVNHAAFHVIDSPQKAYVIGFLLANGFVREPTIGISYRVNLRILAADIGSLPRLALASS